MTKINNLEELNAYMEKNGKNLRRADLGEANLDGADLTNAYTLDANFDLDSYALQLNAYL